MTRQNSQQKGWMRRQGMVVITFFSSFLISAVAVAGEPGAKIRMTEKARAVHEFFAQFGKDYISPVPVVERIEEMGETPVIFAGTLHTLQWDSVHGMLDAWWKGEWISDLEVVYDDDRIEFQGAFELNTREEFIPTLTGSIVAGPGSTLILTIGNHRLVIPVAKGAGGVNGSSPEGYPIDDGGCATCVCFGLGKSTKKCTDENCDEGVSCGKKRACRWKAGEEYCMG